MILSVSFKLAKSNILYRKERTILTMFSIAFSIFISFILLSLVQGFLNTVEKSMKNKNIEMVITTKDIPVEIGPIIINPSINSIPMELYNTLMLYQNNYTLTPAFKSIINIDNKLIPLIALDFEKIKYFYPSIEPPLFQKDIVLIGKKLSSIIKTNTITIQGKNFSVYTINKDLNGYEDYSIFIDFRNYLQISKRTSIDQIWINNVINKDELSKMVSNYNYLTLIEYSKVNYIQQTVIASIKILQVIMIIASISIALIASTNTILITTFERIPEFTIVLAIGAPRAVVFVSLLLEGLVLSVISSIVGIIIGIITITLINNSLSTALNISIPLLANTFTVVKQILLISTFIGIISSILPAYIASNINIQENIRM